MWCLPAGQQQVGLVGRVFDVVLAGRRCLGYRGRRQSRALRQRGGHLRGDGLGLGTVEVADQRDHQIAGGIGARMELAQLLHADARHRLGGAFAGVRVGMRTIELLEQFEAGQLAGVLLLEFEAGQQLVLDPLQRILGEGRTADHFAEQLERRRALVRGAQAAQAGHRHVAVGAVAEVGAEPLEALGNGGDILAGDAFVEHRVGQQGQPWRAGVLAAAGGEGQAQVEHRQLVSLDEQHLGAFGGLPGLDVELASRQWLLVEAGQRFQARCVAAGRRRAGLGGCRRRLGWRDRGVLIAAGQGQAGGQQQAGQAAAQGAGIIHRRSPRAARGRRSGAWG